jgi:hypothetical protein
MASPLNDLADLISHHRANAEKLLDSEIAKLRVAHGDKAIGMALQLAARKSEQHAAVSIAAARERHDAQRAAERRAQAAFRKQSHDNDDEPVMPLPPAWR